MSYETDRIAALEDLIFQEAIKTKAVVTGLSAACERNGNLSVELSAAKAKLSDIESMQCTQCAMVDSLRAELAISNEIILTTRNDVTLWTQHTVDALRQRDKSLAAVKRRDGVIEWIILNGLPGLVECDCHGCQEQRRDCIAAKLKESK